MISKKKTTVSALRQLIGISLEEFAEVISKSPSTVASLESGRLKLSEETALTIALRTGVSVSWLLDEKPRSAPYWVDPEDNRHSYTKKFFENFRALDEAEIRYHEQHTDSADVVAYGVAVITKWLSIHAKAYAEQRVDLANYLMRDFLDRLAERLGTDDEAFFEQNRDARLVDAKGRQHQWLLVTPEDAQKMQSPWDEQTGLVFRKVRTPAEIEAITRKPKLEK